MEQTLEKKQEFDASRKLVDTSDDKLVKSALKGAEEPLGAADDDVDMEGSGLGGKRSGKGK